MSAATKLAATIVIATATLATSAIAETPIPRAPDAWVTDNAGLLAPATTARLDARLADADRLTGHQILVYVDRSTGGSPIEDWAARAFAAWRVGRKGIDDGVVLFVFTEDRQLRIEVGYGLEATIPDARAARIINEVIAPQMSAGQPDRAIEAGVDALLAAVGAPAGLRGPGELIDLLPRWAVGVGVLLIVLLLIAFATHPALVTWILFLLARGGGGGNRRSGGGGFSGGGGRSGGGGASGSW